MKRCLIVVDYQNDFVTGAFGFKGADALDSRIAGRIRDYHQRGDAVLFTRDIHSIGDFFLREGRCLPAICRVRRAGVLSFYGQTGEEMSSDDCVFEKSTFGSDALYEHLKRTPYACIELAGLVTNICVLVNAVLARTAQPETKIVIDERLVASDDKALGEQALNVMRFLHIDITDGKDRVDERGLPG